MIFPFSFMSRSDPDFNTLAITFSTGASNAQSWSGDVPIGISDAVLPDEFLTNLDANDGSIRAYSDAALTTELPLDVCYSNPHWYRRGSILANYGAHIQPAAKYYASLGTSGRVVHAYIDAHEQYVQQWDVDTATWLEPVYVGSSPDEIRAQDTHGNPALILDPHDSTWHLFGGGHNTEWAHWTSSDLVTWSSSTAIPGTEEASYPNLHILGDDVAMFMRCYDGAGDDVIGVTKMYLKSGSWTSPTIVTDLQTNGPAVGVASDDERTYHTSVLTDALGNVHFGFTYHAYGSNLYPYVVYAVLHPTLTSGDVTNFRWYDIAGNPLGAEGDVLTWARVTASPSTTLLFGATGDGAAVESAYARTVPQAVQNSFSIDLDDDGYPHLLLRITADATLSTADLWYVRWNGTSWDADRAYYASGTAPLSIPTIAINAATADDVTVVCAQPDDGEISRLHYNGLTWSRTVISPLPAPDPNYRLSGCTWRAPIKVVGAVEAGIDLQVIAHQENATVVPFGREPGGGFPSVGLNFDGSIVPSKKFLAFVLAPVPSSGDTTIYLHRDGSSTLPAVGSTYGRNAVWADFDLMCVFAAETQIAHRNNYSTPVMTDRTGGGHNFSFYGQSTDVEIETGVDMQLPAQMVPLRGVEALYLPDQADAALPFQELADYANYAAIGEGDIAGDFLWTMVGAGGMLISENDESENDVYQYVTTNADPIVASTRDGGAVATNATLAKPADDILAVQWLGNIGGNTQQLAVNGALSAEATADFATQSVLNSKRIAMFKRSSGASFFTGRYLMVGLRNNQSVSAWRNGRAEVESYAWSRLGDPSFYSVVAV